MMRTGSCAPADGVDSSPVLVFDDKDLVMAAGPTEMEGEHRRTKRNREGKEGEGGGEQGEGGGAAAAADEIFSPRGGRSSAVRRLTYDDNEDVLGTISQLPDDGKVEQEPHMSQAWNQDSESPIQPVTPVPVTQPLTPVPVTQREEVDTEDDVEEGEIPAASSSASQKPPKAG
jgi:hypothetical protein